MASSHYDRLVWEGYIDASTISVSLSVFDWGLLDELLAVQQRVVDVGGPVGVVASIQVGWLRESLKPALSLRGFPGRVAVPLRRYHLKNLIAPNEGRYEHYCKSVGYMHRPYETLPMDFARLWDNLAPYLKQLEEH